MLKISRSSLVASIFGLALVVGLSATPAEAHGTFDIEVKHNINGRALGLDKELPVDVYLNGDYAFTFEFGDTFAAELPANVYSVDVKLGGTGTTVISLPPTPIPSGVSVVIRAQLSGNKTPILRVGVK